jgi:hypothetical protein
MDILEKDNVCIANEIAQELIEAANFNEEKCENDTCFLVYGILRDCGYQVKKIIGEKT